VLKGEKKGPSAVPWLRLPETSTSSFAPCHGDRAARAPDVNMAAVGGFGRRWAMGHAEAEPTRSVSVKIDTIWRKI